MRLSLIVSALCLSAFALPDIQDLYSRQDGSNSLLIDPPGHPPLPSAQAAEISAAHVGLDLNNIQGDILVGMKKNKELFHFFKINDKTTFKSSLTNIHPLITTTTQILSAQSALNIAFSQSGLSFLGITDDLKDDAFKLGQFADAENLSDPGTGNWVNAFKGTNIHGVFLLAADTDERLFALLSQVKQLLGTSASEVYSLKGAARPGDQQGHEHFGYLDGVSQPAVEGFTREPLPGQTLTDPGIFLLGETGDRLSLARPAWAKDGSFLAFRQLKQLVPEFNDFVRQNALNVSGLTVQENTDLFGARMMGRWKSGAPIDLAPLRDDKALGADPKRNNDFTFEHPGADIKTNQTNCPFSAHIRKTRPRADLSPVNTANQIIRAGIPYGPEVTEQENQQKKSSDSTDLERGLAFVSYQSNIGNGFQFIQKTWASNPNFLFGKKVPPGVDPIIGSTPDTHRPVSGLDPLDPGRIITIQKGARFNVLSSTTTQ
ncbi:hypothetical protein E1B28_009089 [Marasmius oreades]|uniref:Dye-decolorizing peroxidase n=1 Tax=Marasmius oreades TaxID=181124 RepID=A0A9P7UT16_9AGAR|nr:uncharacterized protein E1B28_009089 [Marasmius oreades]KAG7092765.1 hypothetical protein E1B28_009089 [Marasmius oreades]